MEGPAMVDVLPAVRFFDTAEAARYLSRGKSTFAKHRCYGTGPVYQKIGRRVLYGGKPGCLGCDEAAKVDFGPSHPRSSPPGCMFIALTKAIHDPCPGTRA